MSTSNAINVERPLDGLETWINAKNGFRVVDLKFSADPRKRSPEWLAQARQAMPSAEFAREFGDQWIVYDGKPVYQDFDDIHVTHGPLVVPKRPRLLCGWDAGPNDVNLAWALGITAPGEARVQFVDYYAVDDGDIEDFVQVVASRLRMEWFRLSGFAIHVCDQSVFTKSGVANGKAVADIMRTHGMAPIPGEISFAKRRASVERLLTRFHRTQEGRPFPDFTVHERCDLIVDSMRGGYCYGRSTTVGGSQWKETPLKNKFSHVMNAVEYVCSRIDLATLDIPYEGQRLPAMSIV